MKAIVWFLSGATALWVLFLGVIAAQRIRERLAKWRARRRWERDVFDPSFTRMVVALEDMIEGASK